MFCFRNKYPPPMISCLTSSSQLVTSTRRVIGVGGSCNEHHFSPTATLWVLFTQNSTKVTYFSSPVSGGRLLIAFSWRPNNAIHGPLMRFSGQMIVTGHLPALFGLHEYTLWQLTGWPIPHCSTSLITYPFLSFVACLYLWVKYSFWWEYRLCTVGTTTTFQLKVV